MPEISRFLGMIVTMYYNDHPPAHVHVRYGGYRAKIDIETGGLIDGHLPSRALSLMGEWCQMHREALRANWRRAMDHEALHAIEPLE